MKEDPKTRKTAEIEKEGVEEVEDIESASQAGQIGDKIEELKKFIREKNSSNSKKKLAEDIRRHNDERMVALETSLAFALEANETLAKRLAEVEKRAERAEKELLDTSKRMFAIEEQLDQLQHRDLQDWLVFSGPAIPPRSRAGTGEDVAGILYSLLRQHMDYAMNMEQVRETTGRIDRSVCASAWWVLDLTGTSWSESGPGCGAVACISGSGSHPLDNASSMS